MYVLRLNDFSKQGSLLLAVSGLFTSILPYVVGSLPTSIVCIGVSAFANRNTLQCRECGNDWSRRWSQYLVSHGTPARCCINFGTGCGRVHVLSLIHPSLFNNIFEISFKILLLLFSGLHFSHPPRLYERFRTLILLVLLLRSHTRQTTSYFHTSSAPLEATLLEYGDHTALLFSASTVLNWAFLSIHTFSSDSLPPVLPRSQLLSGNSSNPPLLAFPFVVLPELLTQISSVLSCDVCA